MAKNLPIRGNYTSGMDQILDMPRCRLSQIGAQSIANGGVVITFGTVFYDTDGFFNAAATSRATIHTQGIYDVKQAVVFTANAGGASRQSWVQVNGGVARYAYDQQPPSAVLGRVGGSDTIALSAGDYIEIFAYQDTGGALLLAPVANTYNGADLLLTLLSTS